MFRHRNENKSFRFDFWLLGLHTNFFQIFKIKLLYMNTTSQFYLNCKCSIAEDFFREGKITRSEMLRIELDTLFGENTGPLKFNDNSDYVDGTM